MVREQTDRLNDDDDYVLIFAEELYRLVGLSPTLGLVFNLDKCHLSKRMHLYQPVDKVFQ